MSLNLIGSLEYQIGRYVRGVCIEFLFVSALSIVGYSVIKLQYAFILGIIVGLFNIIPLIGPFVGIIPAMVASFTQRGDVSFLIPILIVNFIVQFIDAKYIKPWLYKGFYVAHPLMVLLVVLLGGALLGIRGTLLAIPIFTALAITARETRWGLSRYQITKQ